MAGGQTLAAVRSEDWFRFGPSGAGEHEVLEPSLTLEEAKGIFSLFSTTGRCHSSVDSPIWAYERIGTPRLLMEYVYYLTHGTMLEERLESQLKSITARGEDAAKIEILRRTSLASVFGVPILLEPLVEDVGHRDDVQHILQSLDGEYLTIEGSVATGLHHVRSEHLARILHRTYPNPAQTAVKTLPAVPPDRLPTFVAGVFGYPGVDRKRFMEGLTGAIKADRIPTAVKILEGLFTAGERDFLETNQTLYDEAYERFGSGGLTFLGMHLLPVVKVHDALRSMEHIAKKDGGSDSFLQIRQIAEGASVVNGRGMDLCEQFLELFCPTISANDLTQDIASSGMFLDWCALCDVRAVAWDGARETILADPSLFDLDIDLFCRIMQGFYRLEKPFYESWFEANSALVLGHLQVHTKSVKLVLDEDDSVTREFLVLGDAKVAHENNLIQIERLRSALPFCKTYKSRGIWAIPDGLSVPVDDTVKAIPVENWPHGTDVTKNKVLGDLVTERYLRPDSYYRYQELWYAARETALRAVELTTRGLEFAFNEARLQDDVAKKTFDAMLEWDNRMRRLPKLPNQAGAQLCDEADRDLGQFASSLGAAFVHISHMTDETDKSKRFSLLNFLKAFEYLPSFHQTFARIFTISPDYFAAASLDQRELSALNWMVDLMDVAVHAPPAHAIVDMHAYVRMWNAERKKKTLDALRGVLRPAYEAGLSICLPQDVPRQYPLRTLPIGIDVRDPLDYTTELNIVICSLAEASEEVAHDFYILPTYQNSRFMDVAHHFNVHDLREIVEGKTLDWTKSFPVPVPDQLLGLLPLPYTSVRVPDFVKLAGMSSGLVLGLKSLRPIAIELERLAASDRFDMKLRMVLEEDVQPLLARISEQASSLRTMVRALGAAERRSATLDKFEDFLCDICQIAEDGRLWARLASDSVDLAEFDSLSGKVLIAIRPEVARAPLLAARSER